MNAPLTATDGWEPQAFVRLQHAEDDTHVGCDAGHLASLHATPQPFVLYERPGQDSVLLFDLRHEGYVTHHAHDRGHLRAQPKWEEASQLTLEERGDLHAIRVHDGRYLSVDSDGALLAVAESGGAARFRLHLSREMIGAADKWADCCGTHIGDAAWDKESHKRILLEAARLFREWAARTGDEHGRRFLLLWGQGPFVQGAIDGIHDADYKDPWNDGGLFKSHFYDPTTQLNLFRQPSPSARTRGEELLRTSAFHSSELARRLAQHLPVEREALQEAGYRLGLGLHYLTDLTQPMHASSFGNLLTPYFPWFHPLDRRHSTFEGYAEDKIKDGYADGQDPLTDEEMAPVGGGGFGGFLHGVAKRSHQVFMDHLINPLTAKVHVEGPVVIIDNSWGDEAKPALEAALLPAPRTTARCLLLWTHLLPEFREDAPHVLAYDCRGGVAIDADHCYFRSQHDNSLWRHPQHGFAPPQKLDGHCKALPFLDEDQVYWSGGSGGDELWRVDKDGRNKRRIDLYCKGRPAVQGDQVFFVGMHGGGALFRKNKDGSGGAHMIAGHQPRALVSDGYFLFFRRNETLFAVQPDGKNERSIASRVWGEAAPSESHVYYLAWRQHGTDVALVLARNNYEGRHEEILAGPAANSSASPVVAGGWVYYPGAQALMRRRLDDPPQTPSQQLPMATYEPFAINGRTIFYQRDTLLVAQRLPA